MDVDGEGVCCGTSCVCGGVGFEVGKGVGEEVGAGEGLGVGDSVGITPVNAILLNLQAPDDSGL